ncbi:phosphodiester glycosidase family protein [Alteriqipengyuania sp. 357]
MTLRSTSILALALLALPACEQSQPGEPVIRTDISGEKGVEVASNAPQKAEPSPTPTPTPSETGTPEDSACEPVRFEDVVFTHCVADPAEHRVRMALGSPPYRSLAKFSSSRAKDAPRVAFAMNAGMYDGEGKPIGYYVENRERLQELNRNDGSGNFHMKPNGVFYGTGGTWRIKTSDNFYSTVGDRPDFGTQSGPMLLIDGKLHPDISDDGPSKRIRNGVGVDQAGKAHFVITNRPVSFGQFARFFRDVAKTPNALYLDGSVSSLWDPARGRMDTRADLGPLVVVEFKE